MAKITKEQIVDAVRADEVLATEIRKVSSAVKALIDGPLQKRTIIHLLQRQTCLSYASCESVFDAIAGFDEWALKKKR